MKIKQVLIFCIVAGICYGGATQCFGQETYSLSFGDPQSNILTKRNRNYFAFTVYPSPIHGWGQGRNVADEKERLYRARWPSYGVQTKADSMGVAHVTVNLKRPNFVRAFAVRGYPQGAPMQIRTSSMSAMLAITKHGVYVS